MINKAILVGHLGGDPEFKTTDSGRKIGHLSLATSKRWKDKATGERREQTSWHRVVIFAEHLVEIAEKCLRKGSKIYVEGELVTRTWEDRGERRYVTEVVLGPFHSVLILLDKREGGRAPDGAEDDYGGYGYPA